MLNVKKQIEGQIPPEEECTIPDSGALYRMKTHFQTLKEQCDDKTQHFRELNETSQYPTILPSIQYYLLALCWLWRRNMCV